MNRNTLLRRLSLAAIAACALSLSSPAAAQTVEAQLQVARVALEADRHAVVTQALQLTDAEAGAFWPLYHRYRAAMDQHGDALATLVLEYADLYPDVPEPRAREMLKQLTGLEQKLVGTRTSYLKKVTKALPATKALRFAQIENRLDLALRLKLASGVPLMPIEGQLTGRTTGATMVVEGTPGGVVVRTSRLTATVASVDRPTRRVTLLSPAGIKQTVKAGPDVINFDQIRVGDQLNLVVTEELVVAMGGPEDADGGAAVVALAPQGAQPGGLLAETVQVTATVAALDPAARTATLQFADGSTRTFPVRRDVDLGKRQVGDKVRFRITESVAITVDKP